MLRTVPHVQQAQCHGMTHSEKQADTNWLDEITQTNSNRTYGMEVTGIYHPIEYRQRLGQ